jgi:hypothetical protein
LRTLVQTGFFVCLLAFGGLTPAAAAESWTDATGEYTVEAEFLGIRGADVYLKKANGATIKVPLSRLSPESQQLARRLASAPAMPAAAGDAPDVAMRNLMQQLESGNARAVWDALPTAYQSDINEVVHTFAENMDAQVWNAGATTLQKAVRVFKEKKDFILGHPAVQTSDVDPAVIDANWDTAVGVFETLTSSDLADLEKLKTIDMGQFLDTTGKAMMEKLAEIAESVEQSGLKLDSFPGIPVEGMPVNQLSQVQISTVSQDGDTAVLKVVRPDGEEEESTFVRVDGKWLPEEMVEGWDQAMAEANQAITQEMPQQLADNKQAVMMPMMMVGGVLDQLLAAQTQEQFNDVVKGLMQMALQGAGGPGAPAGPGGAAGGGAAADPFGS